MHKSNFLRRQFHLGIRAFKRNELRRGTGTANNLSAFSGGQLKIVDFKTNWNMLQLKSIPRFDFRFCFCNDSGSCFYSVRRDVVAFFAIRVGDEHNEAGAERIVFNGGYFPGDAEFFCLAEINDAVKHFISAAAMTHGEPALIIAASVFLDTPPQALFRGMFREFLVGEAYSEALAGSRGFESFDGHVSRELGC